MIRKSTRSGYIRFLLLTLTATLVVALDLPAQNKVQPSSHNAPGMSASGANPACCSITGINAATGVVTAKVNSTGQSFQFEVTDIALFNSLRIGQPIFVNFKTRQISVDGKTPSGTIVNLSTGGGGKPLGPVGGAKPLRPANGGKSGNAAPPEPACQITGIDRATGVVTAKVKATGQTFQFKVVDAAVFNSLNVGQGIFANFTTRQISVDGKTPSGTIVNLSGLGTNLKPAPEPPLVPSLTVSPIMMPSPPATCTPVDPTVTVSLNGPAPTGGANIRLSSSNPAALALPQSVTVPQGASTIQTSGRVTASTQGATLTVSASYGGVSGPASKVIVPPVAPGVVAALALFRPSVVGGGTDQGIVQLDGFAPPGGLTIFLSSSAPNVATVPPSVIVPEGKCLVTFIFSTTKVQNSTVVTISASTFASGGGPGATLAVTAGCNSAADCPSNQACDPNAHACTFVCSATALCNGGCCLNGLCVDGTSKSACGLTGGVCVVCGSRPCQGGVCQ